MAVFRSTLHKFKKSHLWVAGVLALMLLAVLLLWYNSSTSLQAIPAIVAQVQFRGEYRIGDGQWQPIVEGQHIPANKGDVTLRGDFHMLAPDGEYVGLYRDSIPIAFYLDHINLTVYEQENQPFQHDLENPMFGASACGVYWQAHSFAPEREDPVEILLHNPHHFGNETAIDKMLSNMALWTGLDFEKNVMESGESQRNLGIFFVIVSLIFLGTALFSTLIHIKNNKVLWLLGIIILFAGVYLAYSAEGVSFWSDSIVTNTTMLGCSMVLYMQFLLIAMVQYMKNCKKAALTVVVILGAINALLFVLPIISAVVFYDIWLYWTVIQMVANLILLVFLIKEFFIIQEKERWIYLGLTLPLLAFGVDVAMTALGFWKGGIASKYTFVIFFAAAMLVVFRIIPGSINALAKAKELETEKIMLNAQLAESRISTMMSQIRPHFIYNTLGSIEQLCKLDPPKAGELVHNFAKYLRGNFRELDNPKPILMSQEMEHVHHYVSIENVRFPDMTFSFEMDSNDFYIPALTVQPLVENAIKHGLMRLEKGGAIRVISYETDSHFYVSVVDDGVGFDTSLLLDERKHVGIRNIRGRLKAMVNGVLEIESTIGVGTRVLITIPKEESK